MDEYAHIDITEDTMFSYVMRDRDICTETLKVLLPEWNIRDIQYVDIDEPETQKSISEVFGGHGVRLDVFLDDGETVYNIEMQTVSTPDIARRARYYRAQIDASQLKAGQTYNELKPGFVIFVCKQDPFRRRRYRYWFENICIDEDGLRLNDGSYTVFFFTGGMKGEARKSLRELMRYMNDTRSYNVEETDVKLIRMIDEAVEEARQSDEWRRNQVLLQTRLREAEERGIKLGREDGIKIGREDGQREMGITIARKMLEKGTPVADVADLTGLPLDKVDELRKQSLN